MIRPLRLCLLPWLVGCAGAFGDVEPPEVTLAGLAFDQPGLFEQRLRLDVRLRNPDDFQLDVERLLSRRRAPEIGPGPEGSSSAGVD